MLSDACFDGLQIAAGHDRSNSVVFRAGKKLNRITSALDGTAQVVVVAHIGEDLVSRLQVFRSCRSLKRCFGAPLGVPQVRESLRRHRRPQNILEQVVEIRRGEALKNRARASIRAV